MQAHGIAGRLTRRRFVASLAAMGVSASGLTVMSGCGTVLPRQAPPKVPLVGYLHNNNADNPAAQTSIDALREGLREQGLVEGRDLTIEFRFAEGQNERLPGLVAELLGLGVRLILAAGQTAPGIARQATDRVPIVLMGVQDPVHQGLVASLARPGGNVTGTAVVGPELITKRIELLAAVAPAARRLARLTNLSVLGQDQMEDAVTLAAPQLGLQLLVLDLRTQADIEPAFEQLRAWRADALIVTNLVPISSPREPVLAQVARSRLPAISANREWVQGGLLLAYGQDPREGPRRAAWYVARILGGAEPGELPIDRATQFDLLVNRTTLANLGLTMPPDLAAQVTEWIE